MTYKLRNEHIQPSHRMHLPMKELQTLTSAVLLSMEAMLLKEQILNRWTMDLTFQTVSAQYPNLAFRLNYFAPMFAASHGLQVGGIHVWMTEVETPAGVVELPGAHNAVNRALLLIGTLTYIAFYERWRKEMESCFTKDIAKWPALFAFGRRLRDFLVHGDGKIAFDKAGAGAISWHRLTYSPRDNGKPFLNTEIAFADLIALMFELDDEMTALGFSSP